MWFLVRLRAACTIEPSLGVAVGLVVIAAVASTPASAQTFAPPPISEPSCNDSAAHFAGFMAFLEVKLAIDDDQRPAWRMFVQQVAEGAKAEQSICISLQNPDQPAEGQSAIAGLLLQREASMFASLQSLRGFRLALEGLVPTLRQEQQEQLVYVLRGLQPPKM